MRTVGGVVCTMQKLMGFSLRHLPALLTEIPLNLTLNCVRREARTSPGSTHNAAGCPAALRRHRKDCGEDVLAKVYTWLGLKLTYSNSAPRRTATRRSVQHVLPCPSDGPSPRRERRPQRHLPPLRQVAPLLCCRPLRSATRGRERKGPARLLSRIFREAQFCVQAGGPFRCV